MAVEYIKREDAIALIKEQTEEKQKDDMDIGWNAGLSCAIGQLETIPAADVVEVIRCKDCRFFAPDTYGDAWCSAKSPGVSKGMFSPSFDETLRRGMQYGHAVCLNAVNDATVVFLPQIVHCCECEYNNHCLTQAFVEEASRIPFDKNTWFCADAKAAPTVIESEGE